jgi:DNA polymerase III subunit gamma/tau
MAEEPNADAGKRPQSLALYRKYRPATFAEVRGQDHVTQPLRQALRSGRINHAYLFSGPRGCGKTSSARILARSLNCVNGPTPEPCGVCDSCVALAPSGPGSIDVIEIDAASHGGVDDARDLRERAFYAPVAGRYKIYIIDEAHMVTQQGFNALLKLVEEPPSHLKFIFATTEPDKVIPTIRSRTHHYPFRLMPPSVMRDLAEEILKSEGVQFDPVVLPLVVRAGGGSARDTLSILDQLLAGSDADGIRYDRAVSLLGYTDAGLLDEIVDAFAGSDGAGVFRAVNRVIEGGHEPRRFATDMLDRFRDLIILASVPDAISSGLLDVPPDRADALHGQARRYGLASLTRAADIVAAGLDQMRGATSPRLLLELLCAQVLLPAAAADELSVLARLERLEAGAPTAARYAQPPATQISPPPSRLPPSPPPPPTQPAVQQAPAEPGPAQPRPAAPPADQRPDAANRPSPAPRPDDNQPHQPAPVQPQAAQPQAAQPQSAHPQSAQPQSAQPPQHQPAPSAAPPASRSSAPFTHAPGSQPPQPSSSSSSSSSSSAAPRGAVTLQALQQAWPGLVESIKSKGRVAAIVIGNGSVAGFDEGVLTLRFPRQGDVKGFQGSKYEDLLKQALNAMFGMNFTIRAITGTGDGPAPGRRSVPPPGGPPAPPAGSGQSAPYGQPSPAQPPAVPPASEYPPGTPPDAASPAGQHASHGHLGSAAPGSATEAGPLGGASASGGGSTHSFSSGGFVSADLPPLPEPPAPDDEDFDVDDEDMSSSSTVHELTGMALVQRELGAEIIAEYED